MVLAAGSHSRDVEICSKELSSSVLAVPVMKNDERASAMNVRSELKLKSLEALSRIGRAARRLLVACEKAGLV